MSQRSKRSDDSPLPVMLLVLAIIVILAGFAFGFHEHSKPKPFSQHVAAMSASADSELFVVGTLAPLGSFEYETAPVLTHLAVLDRHADASFKDGEISHDEAAEVLARGDSVYAIIAQATEVCKPGVHSGKCTGDREKAEELLAEARREAAAIPDYVPNR